MGLSKKKNNESQMQSSYNAQLAQQNALLAEAAKPSALQQKLEAGNLKFLEQTDGSSGPMDITKVEGMSPYLGLYDNAKRGQDQERFGEGALTLAGEGSGGWGKLMKQQRQMQREQDAGGQLTNAFAQKNAEVRGSSLPLIGLHQQRTLGVAGQAGQNASNAGQMWMNYRGTQRPSFWSQLALGAVGAVGQAAGAGATFGL